MNMHKIPKRDNSPLFIVSIWIFAIILIGLIVGYVNIYPSGAINCEKCGGHTTIFICPFMGLIPMEFKRDTKPFDSNCNHKYIQGLFD